MGVVACRTQGRAARRAAADGSARARFPAARRGAGQLRSPALTEGGGDGLSRCVAGGEAQRGDAIEFDLLAGVGFRFFAGVVALVEHLDLL
jgi:hypothetical protein